MHYFQFEIKEWVSNTAHLSLEEEAIYLRLINYYYDSEKPIPKDHAMILRKLRIDNIDMADLILNEFFVTTENGWIHDRCDREIERYNSKVDQASRAGKASANARSTLVQPIINHKSLTINHKSLIINQDNTFNQFWNSYPRKVGKTAALKAWLKHDPDIDLVLKALEWQKKSPQWFKNNGLYIPHASTWINGSRWLDEPTQEESW
jgi:uncharacterized protein YdaU (DUF1376 family)